MIFDKVEVEEKDDGYEVILHIKPNNSLEEFAEEFGLTKKAEEDINRVAIGYVKKNFPTLRVNTIKVMMGGALVTSVMFGGGMTQAFANEHEGEVQSETETLTDNAATETNTEVAGVDATTLEETNEPDSPAPEDSNPTDEGTDTSPVEEEPAEVPIDSNKPIEEEVAMDEPGLVPGDFFYFVEAIAEKLQLALIFDDTAKAELISQFADERIAEAIALFEAGDTEGALDLLNQALKNQELALDYVTEEEGEGPPEEELTSPEGDLPPQAIEGELDPTDDGDAVSGDESDEEDPASKVRNELQTQFSQNITALLLAMEKVENPKAKAALAKNVEKAYAKMEKKLGKMKDIEERIASAIPVDEEVEDLRTDIRNDQEDFEGDMAEVEGEATATGGVPPVATKRAQEKAQNGQEKVQAGQQNAQKKASTGQEKQAEKRATTPAPQNETKVNTTLAGEKEKGNTNENVNMGAKAGGNGNGKAKVETEVNAIVEDGAKVTPTPKANERVKGSEGKGKQDNKPDND